MINNLIFETVKATGKYDVVNEETVLHGDGSPLDSLAFVRLMVDVNVALTKDFGRSVDVFKPEYFLGKKDNPYKTVGSFISHIKIICGHTEKINPELISHCKPVKIIFTDLDGTLWDGISGEGETAWKMNIINELSRLNQSGILVVLVTKNYEEIVSSYVKGIEQDIDFVCKHYNAFDKASAIRDTCKRLNLGLDSAVFLDDSEHERDYVRSTLPQVWTPENHMVIEKITVEHVTDEDRRRTEMYKQEFARESSKPHSDSTDDYLAWLESLDMVMTIKKAESNEETVRANELIDRSNQFNFGKDRPPHAYNTFIATLKDKFGDMGIIAAFNIDQLDLLYEESVGKLLVYNFCVSCRVLGRGVEKTLADAIKKEKLFLMPPCVSGKNQAALDFWHKEYKTDKKYPIKVIS